jgi:anthranilate phosphoribosyltransferase
MKDMLALNLGCALHLLEDDLSLKQGIERARDAVASGVAAKFWGGKINA